MQMVKKGLLAALAVWFLVIVLMPKTAFYYKVEAWLARQDIVLNETKINEGLFSLELEGVTVYVKGIPIANIQTLKFCTLFLYSSLTVEGLLLDDSLKAMAPQDVNEAYIRQFIGLPFNLFITADGSFGQAEGSVDISARKMHLDFNDSAHVQMLRPPVKKGEKGWYYETSF
ncbi:MAG: hypothetical protein RL113_1454 [Pseudomonadota bacterium]